MTETVRWNIDVSEETDRNLRAYLARRGMREDDLARLIEKKLDAMLFNDMAARNEVRNAKAGISVEEMEEAIDEALTEVRAEMWGPRKAEAG